MAKDYLGKWFTRVQKTETTPTAAGSNVWYGKQNITGLTQDITATNVKSDSIVLVTLLAQGNSFGLTNSYFRMPTFYVTDIVEATGFTVQTVIASVSAGYTPVTSYVAHWMIANPTP
jgi:hypothetical protein